MIRLVVQAPYFRLICTGQKVVEGRLYKSPLTTIKPLDMIQFQQQSLSKKEFKTINAQILYCKKYPSFQEMLEKEGLHRCLPHVKTLEEGVKIYHAFSSYLQDERQYGVLALGIGLIKNKDK